MLNKNSGLQKRAAGHKENESLRNRIIFDRNVPLSNDVVVNKLYGLMCVEKHDKSSNANVTVVRFAGCNATIIKRKGYTFC